MTVRQILTRYYEGTSDDIKPTGVLPGSMFRETDTYFLYETFDGDTWVTIDWGLLGNVAILEHRKHSRIRVYPQDIGATITLAANAAANTFGSWTEIIPINTVGFIYDVTGLVIEQVNAVTSYFIQLGFSIVDGTEPTTAQIMGERRIRLVTVPIARATELLAFQSQNIPANSKLWGRLKTASSAADEAEVSVAVVRHVEITNPIAMLTTWPWVE